MTDPNQYEFFNQRINEMNEFMNSDLGDDVDFDEIMDELGVDFAEVQKAFDEYVPTLDLGYTKLNEDAVTPFYNYKSDSGFDLYSTETINIPPFGRALVPTGLSFDIKDGYEIQVRSKSGLALKQGLMVLNSPGTVDNGYTGEVQVIVFNTNNNSVSITKGMKVAQAVLCPVVNGKWVSLVEKDKAPNKERGSNGFGSTDI